MKLFYQIIEDTIIKVYGYVGDTYVPDCDKKVKAQLAICYSNFPAGLGALGAIGHTAWVQFKKLSDRNTLFDSSEEKIFTKLYHKGYKVHIDTFRKAFRTIVDAVSERLVLEELIKSDLEQPIESYRFFLTSNNDLKFETLPRIIRSVILFGDLLPCYESKKLHPLTLKLFKSIYEVSEPYFDELRNSESVDLTKLGRRWVKDLCFAIAKYLNITKYNDRSSKNDWDLDDYYTSAEPAIPQSIHEKFPGFNEPAAPMLEDYKNLEQMIQQCFSSNSDSSVKYTTEKGGDSVPEEVKGVLNDLTEAARTISNASGSTSNFEDVRSDILVEGLSIDPFESGLVEGSPTEGNDVEIDLGENGTATGQIFDQSYELSFDQYKINALIEEAKPLADKMKRNIFPNTEQVPIVENLRTSGMLDSTRLACFKYTDAIFKRFVSEEILNKRGKPLVLIVCDGSGSMTAEKMHMLKILTTAWINSTLKTTVQIIAGVYNDGQVGGNRHGPKISWLYHPAKTPANSKKHAVRAIASVPERGSGGQKDALEIGYMLQEADKFAKGKRIYMIHITDTQFIGSFNKGMTAEEEVVALLNQRKQKSGNKFHYTLVGLGVTNGGEVEKVADKMICLSPEELTNPYVAASKIGIYVSSCMKERNLVSKSK